MEIGKQVSFFYLVTKLSIYGRSFLFRADTVLTTKHSEFPDGP